MKSKYLFPVWIFSAMLLVSCANINQTIYIQDVEVNGPMNPPPVPITKDKSPGTVTFSPKLTLNNTSEVIGNIGSGRYMNTIQDTLFPYGKKNILWKIPKYSFGFDLDVAVSNSFAIAGGLNYSVIDQTKLIGGSLGIALFHEKNGSAIRFDVGILVQELYYDAKTIVETTVDPI